MKSDLPASIDIAAALNDLSAREEDSSEPFHCNDRQLVGADFPLWIYHCRPEWGSVVDGKFTRPPRGWSYQSSYTFWRNNVNGGGSFTHISHNPPHLKPSHPLDEEAIN